MGVWVWHWNQSPIKTIKASRRANTEKGMPTWSNMKVLLTVFFDCNSVVHYEFLPQGRIVNKEYYLEVMSRLREAIRQKRTELWKNQSWFLHHNNEPAHTSMLVREFMAPQLCLNLNTHRNWPSLTFSSSQNWRHRWKESILFLRR